MKWILMLSLLLLGCNNLKRLTGSVSYPPPDFVRKEPTIPDFNIPTIIGYQINQYQGWVDNGEVLLAPNCPYISTWVDLNNKWIKFLVPSQNVTYDSSTGMLKYSGISNNGYYVIYQWVPR